MTTIPPQNKILGSGFVRRTGKSMVITENTGREIRNIDLPIEAIRYNYLANTYEPQTGDELVFSAQLMNGRYVAMCAIQPQDLITAHGVMDQIDPKYKYAHISLEGKNSPSGRVFVPFSTRNSANTFWYGHNGARGNRYTVQIFRQEENHGCRYVAWRICEDRRNGVLGQQNGVGGSVSTVKRFATSNVSNRGDHLCVEFVTGHSGVIYDVDSNRNVFVSSPTTQNVMFPPEVYEKWMRPGRFVRYDATRVSEVKTDRLIGSNPEDLGAYFEYPLHQMPLALKVSAVINKVIHHTSLWAFNDFIGRIYLPWGSLDREVATSDLVPFASVHIEVAYNGKHDDIPWVASHAFLADDEEDDERVRAENATQLMTDDGWLVENATPVPENMSLFLTKTDENGQKLTAFAKKVDINGYSTLKQGTLVRATYFRQKRHGRHAFRAVLVTPMNDVDKLPFKHVMHNGSGTKVIPALFEEPIQEKKPVVAAPATTRVLAAPPPKVNCWAMSRLGSPKTHNSPPGFPAVAAEPKKAPIRELVRETPKETTPVPEQHQPLFATPALPDRIRPLSVWSGTPAEDKSDPLPLFSHEPTSLFNNAFGPTSSLYPSTSSFYPAPISKQSSASLPSSGADMMNTQSGASSPGVSTDEEGRANVNVWDSQWSLGLSLIEQPRYEPPRYEPLKTFSSSTKPPVKSNCNCNCQSNALITQLWNNQFFINAFSNTDPDTFYRIQTLMFSKTSH